MTSWRAAGLPGPPPSRGFALSRSGFRVLLRPCRPSRLPLCRCRARPAGAPASVALGPAERRPWSQPRPRTILSRQGSDMAVEDWRLISPTEPRAQATPSSAASANPFSPVAPASAARDAQPFSMRDAGEGLPSAAAFDARPATWGARALAALGGQAGIGPASGTPATGLGLLDDVQAEPAESYPLAGSPALKPPADLGDHQPQPFALDDAAETSPLEFGLGANTRASADEILAAARQPRRGVEKSRGDALLEDELVDSPKWNPLDLGLRPAQPGDRCGPTPTHAGHVGRG